MKKANLFKIYTRPNRKYFIFGVVFLFISALCLLLLTQTIQLFIDSVYQSTGTQTEKLSAVGVLLSSWLKNLSTPQIVLWLSLVFVALTLIKNLCTFLANQNFYGCAYRSRSALRKSCFKKLAFLKNGVSPSQVFFNTTSDVDDFSDVIYKHLPKMLDGMFKIVFCGIICFFVSTKITLCFFVFVPIVFVVGLVANKKLVQNFTTARNEKSKMFGVCADLVENARDIKIFGTEHWATKNYEAQNTTHTTSIINSHKLIINRKAWLNALRALGIICAIVVSAISCLNGEISIGYFALIISFAFIIFDASVNFVLAYLDTQISEVSVSRLQQLLDEENLNEQTATVAPKKFDITFEGVNTQSATGKTFPDLNFVVPQGKHVAIILKQAQGKTTLAKMFFRFVNKSCGKIKFNNTEYENFEISSLRQRFSYIPQEPVIFEGSISENICMFAKPNKAKLEKVAKICCLDELIKSFPFGFDEVLTENGGNLPTQDKQKIAIARALYRNAPVLLIDSAFKKFDAESSVKLMKNILEYYTGKTVIFITNHTPLSKLFDKTITLDEGGTKK